MTLQLAILIERQFDDYYPNQYCQYHTGGTEGGTLFQSIIHLIHLKIVLQNKLVSLAAPIR